ncbi:DUF2726 domain-containing protein [Aquabacterium sp. A7-Y]|uniref:DUF2726 domain-containing protein n=1 Tax=Aquabacterium sp. A7-Y TaxID=1349605 RepID=UPI00223DD077|nr:DUF2726 domain-containing protein [Aquabacterium sp. A7-Y]MCW7539928.1 DUF2726 domain-containing protein [Aquabacterium sp. A7-Y]
MQTEFLIAALAGATLLLLGLLAWQLSRRRRPPSLPKEWHLMLRPVFTADERRMHRQLREAFPQHIVLAKLPLTRFTQPTEPSRVAYWHGMIGALHVTFAICTPNGRVVAAIDVEGRQNHSRRATAIKTGVLEACRVRYLRFFADELPSLQEVQRLVDPDPAGLGAAPAGFAEARDTLATTVRKRREQRAATGWQDSSFSQDSFFAPDSRLDGLVESGFMDVAPASPPAAAETAAPVPPPEPTPALESAGLPTKGQAS